MILNLDEDHNIKKNIKTAHTSAVLRSGRGV